MSPDNNKLDDNNEPCSAARRREFLSALCHSWGFPQDAGPQAGTPGLEPDPEIQDSRPLQHLLDAGLDPNAPWGEIGMVRDTHPCCRICVTACDTPWHFAVLEGNRRHKSERTDFQAESMLLRRGANINSYNDHGRTVLHELLSGCYNTPRPSIIGFLCENGADVNLPTKPSTTRWIHDENSASYEWAGGLYPLTMAIHQGNHELARLLIERGADVNLQTSKGWTPLDLAILQGPIPIPEILLSFHGQLSEADGDHHPEAQGLSDQEAARQLLQTVNKVPPSSARPFYCRVLREVNAHGIANSRQEEAASKAEALSYAILDSVHESMDPASFGVDKGPRLQHCKKCVEFQLRKKTMIWDSLAKFSQAAETESCPLCVLFVQLFKESLEFRHVPLDAVAEGFPIRVHYVDHDNDLEQPRPCIAISHGETDADWIFLRPQLLPDDIMKGLETPFTDERERGSGTGSPGAFRLARNWLNHCHNLHAICRNEHPMMAAPLPTRVIDVGGTGKAPTLVESRGKKGDYCTLSYCWGTSTTLLKTTRETLSAFHTGIPLDRAPPTIREAISVARELGFQYIWIDCLCIVQDDEDDWAREAARMAQVYMNSRLTIAADVSRSVDHGLFRPRRRNRRINSPVRLMPQWSHERRSGSTSWYATLTWKRHSVCEDLVYHPPEPSPLSSRGWALQENLLSRRILLFGDGVLSWRCLCAMLSEEDPSLDDGTTGGPTGSLGETSDRPQAWSELLWNQVTSKGVDVHPDCINTVNSEKGAGERLREYPFLFRDIILQKGTKPVLESCDFWDDYFTIWSWLVVDFTRLKLSNPNDRIAAILGLATCMEPLLKGTLVQGVWTGSYAGARSLAWRVERALDSSPHENPTLEASWSRNERFPSWSWASTTSPVAFDMLPTSRRFMPGCWWVEYEAELLSVDQKRLKLATCTFSTDVLGNWPSMQPAHEPHPYVLRKLVWDHEPETGSLLLVVLARLSKLANKTLDDLIQHCADTGTSYWDYIPEPLIRTRSFVCLCAVRTPVADGERVFRRVGICEIEERRWVVYSKAPSPPCDLVEFCTRKCEKMEKPETEVITLV